MKVNEKVQKPILWPLRVFDDHHMWPQNWPHYVWTSLCQVIIFNLLHSPVVWLFDNWNIFLSECVQWMPIPIRSRWDNGAHGWWGTWPILWFIYLPFLAQSGCNEVSRYHTKGESEEFIPYRLQKIQAMDATWLWSPGQTSPEEKFKTGVWAAPQKRTYVIKFFKKNYTVTEINTKCEYINILM